MCAGFADDPQVQPSRYCAAQTAGNLGHQCWRLAPAGVLVQDADMGQQSASGGSGWCPELDPMDRTSVPFGQRQHSSITTEKNATGTVLRPLPGRPAGTTTGLPQ